MTADLPSPRDLGIVAGVAVGLYVALIALAHLLGRTRGIRFSRVYHAFAVAAGLLLGLHLCAWRSPVRETLLAHLTAATLILASWPIVTLLNRVLWVTRDKQGRKIEAPRVLADLTTFIVITIAVLTALQFVYDVKVPGLLAGSGVAALVLGLGMQDQLRNLFAGVSIHLSKPFKTGDWLLIDGCHAKVVGISWRAIRLLTNDDVVIEVGNNEILRQTVTNFHEPRPCHAVRATIGLHYTAPPARVQELLRHAVAAVPGICVEPAPVVYVKEFADSAIVYEVKVWIDDHALMNRVLSDVRSHCWYAVNRAGIEIPYPQMTLHRAKTVDPSAGPRSSALAALRAHPIFSFLASDQLEQLVRESAVVTFAPAERIIEQDAVGASLFLVVKGRVEVQIRRGDRLVAVAKLGAGDCFGEMSLLAGEPRSATVMALTEVEAVEIAKPAFASLVHCHPEVIGRLSELLAQRQLANAQEAATHVSARSADQLRSGMRARLKAFFELGG